MATMTKDAVYRRVADSIQAMIDEGTYEPGDRLPSLRDLSRSLSVALNTVREAYLVLESRGEIEARPQSGFYVARPSSIPLHPPRPRPEPSAVSATDMIHQLMTDAQRPEFTNLALALPDPDLLPLRELERALVHVARYRPEALAAYQFADQTRELRGHIARRLHMAGVTRTPDEIGVSAGCMEAVSLALLVTCSAGDTIAMESPAYFSFRLLAAGLGLRVVEVPSHPARGLLPEVLEYVLDNHDVRAILCAPNFNNPTGALMPDDDKRRIVALAGARGIDLIEDDIYGETAFDGSRPTSLMAFDDEGVVIHCSSFSKTLGPGFRIGWFAGGRRHDQMLRLKEISSLSVSAPSVQAVTRFLAAGGYDRHLRRYRRKLYESKVRLSATIRESFPEGTRLTCPAGGMVVWVQLPRQIDSTKLYGACRDEGICIAAGPLFTESRDFHHFVRFSAGRFGAPEEQALRVVGAIARRLATGPHFTEAPG